MSGPFTPEQKREIVVALLTGRTSTAELCRQHQVSSTALYQWRDRFMEGGLKALQGDTPSKREQQLERENDRLKELVGELALANHALKKGLPANGGRKR